MNCSIDPGEAGPGFVPGIFIFCAEKAKKAIPITANNTKDRIAMFLFRWLLKTERFLTMLGTLVGEVGRPG
ncbi:hypothetical protein AUF78_12560 [archaeon 13_1_20CM_2_51_12]|nr:MAG: hypothetical protein AUF78_12560 [archaeon 13_1_20CM_2_51_12]